jgi:diguanylate cyclase (GGDEF)-like protein
MRTITTVWVTVALMAVVGIIVALQVGGLVAQNRAERAWHTRVQFAHDLEQVRYYDELLTMSARMAAATGDPTYQARYENAVPHLDTVLKHALSLAGADARAAIARTDEANFALVVLEERAFELLAAGDREGAYELLTGPEYLELKDTYADGLEAGLLLIDQAVEAETSRAGDLQVGALATGAAVALLLAVFLMVTTGRLRASQRARSEMEERLRRQAHQDPLTGLANRRLFRERLAAALDGPAPPAVAVLFADLDGFKVVNDTYGHASGDRVLVEVAGRVRDLLPELPGGLAARLGGDEFALLVPAASRAEADRVAARLMAVLARPYAGGNGLPITASVGVAFTATGGDPGELLRAADHAMYETKVARRHRPAEGVPAVV